MRLFASATDETPRAGAEESAGSEQRIGAVNVRRGPTSLFTIAAAWDPRPYLCREDTRHHGVMPRRDSHS